MGFGIAAFGFCVYVFYELGGGLFGSLMIAYGLYLASTVQKRFLYAAISALVLFPHSVFIALRTFGIIPEKKYELLYSISAYIHIIAFFLLCLFYITSVKIIADSNKNEKFSKKSINRMSVVTVYTVLALGIPVFGIAQLNIIVHLLFYIIVIINALFMFDCYIMITTPRRYEKEKYQLIQEQKNINKKNKKK